MVMRGVVIRRGTSAVQPAPTSPLAIGIVGTAPSKASGTNYNQAYRVATVAEATAIFGAGNANPSAGSSITNAMAAIENHVRVPVYAVAVDLSGGLETAQVRTRIDAAVPVLPTQCTYIGAPQLTFNYNGSGAPLTTACSTVAVLNTRAGQIDAIAVTDIAYDTVANMVAYLNVAAHKAARVLPVAPRINAGGSAIHAASAVAMGAMARNEIDNGAQRTPSNIPVYGVVSQEVEMLRSRTDTTAAANQVLTEGGSVIAYSGADWRLYGGILGAAAGLPERFVSVRRVVDIAENRLESVLSPFEDTNLVGDAIGTIVDAADGELSRMRAAGLFGGYTVAPNAEYNIQSNLVAGQVGIQVTLNVYTPIGLIDVLLNLAISTPTA